MPHVLRVAVSPPVAALPERSGHGRMWQRVLAELEGRVRLDVREPGRRLARRPDAWLADGHRELPDVAEPIVAQVHEAPPRDPAARALLDPAFAAHLEAAVVATVARADAVVTLSYFSARELQLEYGLPAEQLHVAHLGVDPEVFSPREAGAGRERIGAPYVLFVGVLHPRKNIGVLREAMARLAAQGLPHVLAVVGAPPADRADPGTLVRDALAELPGAPGRVIAVEGAGDAELAALYAGADAFCLPSLSEGFGLPALEAMACGTPVVAADRGALPEVVGDAGVLVEPTALGVELGLARVLGDPRLRAELHERGRERAQGFTWARTADAWVEALDRVTAR
jgi:glycosyltransferase involved in cell wall biosynthesis